MNNKTEFMTREFESITRTVYTLDFGDGPVTIHTLDAVASDGSAWWKVVAPTDEDSTDWQRHDALPRRKVHIDASAPTNWAH